jgi:hypothetical protein
MPMRIAPWATVGALALAVAGGAPARPSRSALTLRPSSSIQLRNGYTRLVADGKRSAAVKGCSIALWTVAQPKASAIDGCRSSRQLFLGVDEIAVAGSRLAWMRHETNADGLQLQTELIVKTGSAKPHEIADTFTDGSTGGTLLTLAGQRNTLAFAFDFSSDGFQLEEHVYKIAQAETDHGADWCPHSTDGLLPTPPPKHLCIDPGLGTGLVRSVSDGRVLVSFGDDLLGVVQADNSERDLPIPFKEETDQVALSGTQVVVLHAGATTLDVYSDTGALQHKWPIPLASSPRKLSVAGGVAVYASHGLHLVRLANGSATTLRAPGGKPPIAAAMTPSGLYALYSVKRRERLGFVPIARLQGALGA